MHMSVSESDSEILSENLQQQSNKGYSDKDQILSENLQQQSNKDYSKKDESEGVGDPSDVTDESSFVTSSNLKNKTTSANLSGL